MVDEGAIYAAVGEDGLTRLVAAFYRQVENDDVLGPMYSAAASADGEDSLVPAEGRLRDFLIYRLGGPPRYLERRGHPALRRRHFRFAIDDTARARWVTLMERALDEVAFPADVDTALREFFAGVAAFLVNTQPANS